MKYYFAKFFVAFCILSSLFGVKSFANAATGSGACSYHGGVDCGAGWDYDGSVICVDGTADSSVMYSSVIKCKENPTPLCTSSEYSQLMTKYDVAAAVAKISNLYIAYLQKQADIQSQPIAMEFINGQLTKAESEYLTQYAILVNQASFLQRSVNSECRSLALQQANKDQEDEQDKINEIQDQIRSLCASLGNSYLDSNNQCHCSAGFVMSKDGNSCIDYNASCRSYYGTYSYGNADYCYCNDGYEFNTDTTACIPKIIQSITTDPSLSGESNKSVESSTTAFPKGGVYIATKKDSALLQKLKGRILLQVEDRGEAWYVNPIDSLRYYMKDGAVAYGMMRSFGLGITDADLGAIPSVSTSQEMLKATSVCASNAKASKLKGRIVLQVQAHGEAWYIDPQKCLRIYMRDGNAAYQIMRYLGLGIKNTDLEKLPSGL
ncbi:hypothetical protein KBC59_00670 [Patescibacteria group bacterium]|nr:hypothetical protein [Patescibacteria group bacterium]